MANTYRSMKKIRRHRKSTTFPIIEEKTEESISNEKTEEIIVLNQTDSSKRKIPLVPILITGIVLVIIGTYIYLTT